MSVSTRSITANPLSVVTRRRAAVEKKQPATVLDIADSNFATTMAAAAVAPPSTGYDILAAVDAAIKEPIHNSIQIETRNADTVVKTPLPTSNGTAPSPYRAVKTKKVAKPAKPRWLTALRAFTKNSLLLLIIFGLVEMIRRLVIDSRTRSPSGLAVISDDFEGKFAEMDSFVKKTTKMIQVQVDVIDKKLENEIRTVKGEFIKKLEGTETEFESKLRELDERTGNLEASVSKMEANNWVSKEDLDKLVEELKEMKGSGISDVSLDEVRAYAREIVEREIEKHAADGLGKVDYALASGGAMVVKHSEPYIISKGGSRSWIPFITRETVHMNAQKILTPSFGEPGRCFPLRGGQGFVQIRLRTAIIPEAVTLEHVTKNIAYDRSSAPKNCRVTGWLQGEHMTDEVTADSEKVFLLTEFTYDLEKSNAQTYNVLESAATSVVDTIRLDFASNHGSILHTCIYRLRVHGREPNSVLMLA